MMKDVYIGDLVNRISLATFSKQRDVLNIGGMEVPLTVDTGLIGTLRANSKDIAINTAEIAGAAIGIAMLFMGAKSILGSLKTPIKEGLARAKDLESRGLKVNSLQRERILAEQAKQAAIAESHLPPASMKQPAWTHNGTETIKKLKSIGKISNTNWSEKRNFTLLGSLKEKVSGWVNGIFDNMKSYDESSLMGMIKSANKLFTDAFNDVEIEKLKKMGFMVYVKKNKTYLYTGLISKNADKYSPKNYKSQFTKIDTLKDHLSVV